MTGASPYPAPFFEWSHRLGERAKRRFDPKQPWLTVRWCDYCGRAVNQHDERDHVHLDQCLFCRWFRAIDSDWGWCRNTASVYCGRKMFEHDSCFRFERCTRQRLASSLPVYDPMPDDGGASHLAPCLAVPDLALPATSGPDVNLATIAGLSVVFVYPWTGRPDDYNPPGWDDIPGAHGSTPEAEGFRDLYPSFRNMGVGVFGLSLQDTAYQRELSQRLRLPFAVLSDAGFRFTDALALPRFETGGVTYLKRLTLVLRDGRIEKTFYPVHPPDKHARDVIDRI